MNELKTPMQLLNIQNIHSNDSVVINEDRTGEDYQIYHFNVINLIQHFGSKILLENFPDFILDVFPYFRWKFYYKQNHVPLLCLVKFINDHRLSNDNFNILYFLSIKTFKIISRFVNGLTKFKILSRVSKGNGKLQGIPRFWQEFQHILQWVLPFNFFSNFT